MPGSPPPWVDYDFKRGRVRAIGIIFKQPSEGKSGLSLGRKKGLALVLPLFPPRKFAPPPAYAWKFSSLSLEVKSPAALFFHLVPCPLAPEHTIWRTAELVAAMSRYVPEILAFTLSKMSGEVGRVPETPRPLAIGGRKMGGLW